MKKLIKKISALALCLLLISALTVSAFADSSVDYKGGAEKFVFLDGSEHSDSDLFANFKNVFPGDELVQTVEVRNSFAGPKSVRIYLKALPHGEANPPVAESRETVESMNEFLNMLTLRIEKDGKTLYEGSPAAGPEENILLGEFKKGSSAQLKLTLIVPIEMGNEFADRLGEVDWVFTAEEIPQSDKPKTGDESGLFLWAGLMCLSAAAGTVLLSRNKSN